MGLQRRILVPLSLSALVMFGLSWVWHGLALNDLRDLTIPLGLYIALAAVAYLIIGAILTFSIHHAMANGWIDIRRAFPLKAMLYGAVVGFVVYLIALVFGMAFTGGKLMHMVVDVLWQMVEQCLGGLMVSLGIIYDLHKSFLENERAI